MLAQPLTKNTDKFLKGIIHFQEDSKIQIDEPSIDEAVQTRGLKSKFEGYHGITYSKKRLKQLWSCQISIYRTQSCQIKQ